jgi:hypothetical protein
MSAVFGLRTGGELAMAQLDALSDMSDEYEYLF